MCNPSSRAPVADLWVMPMDAAARKLAAALGHEVSSSDTSNPGRPGFNTTHGRIVFIDDLWRTWPIIEYTLNETWPTTDPVAARAHIEALLRQLGLLELSAFEWKFDEKTLGGGPYLVVSAEASLLGRPVTVPGSSETSKIGFDAWNTSRIVLGPMFDLREACPTLAADEAEGRFAENVSATYRDVHWQQDVETSFTSLDGRLAYSFRLPDAIRPSEPCAPMTTCGPSWNLVGTVDAQTGETTVTMERVGID